MKKIVLFIAMIVLAFAGAKTTLAQPEPKPLGLQPYVRAPISFNTMIRIIEGQTDTDNDLKDGMTPYVLADHTSTIFNRGAGKALGEKITDIAGLVKILKQCTVMVHTAANPLWKGDDVSSPFHTTGWKLVNGEFKFHSYPRSPREGEQFLVYKGYVICSLNCGNPFYYAGGAIINITPVTFGGDGLAVEEKKAENSTYTGTLTSGQPIIIYNNVYGSTFENVGSPTVTNNPVAQKETQQKESNGSYQNNDDFEYEPLTRGSNSNRGGGGYSNQQQVSQYDADMYRFAKQNRDANITTAVGTYVVPFAAVGLNYPLNRFVGYGGVTTTTIGNGGNGGGNTGGAVDFVNGPK